MQSPPSRRKLLTEMKEVLYLDLGRMGYRECWDKQRTMFEGMLQAKRAGASEGALSSCNRTEVGDAGVLYLVEHNPVYTLGKSGKSENMLVSEPYLRSIGAEFFAFLANPVTLFMFLQRGLYYAALIIAVVMINKYFKNLILKRSDFNGKGKDD